MQVASVPVQNDHRMNDECPKISDKKLKIAEDSNKFYSKPCNFWITTTLYINEDTVQSVTRADGNI